MVAGVVGWAALRLSRHRPAHRPSRDWRFKNTPPTRTHQVPPELPEPALGINFARDGMERRDWFSLIAVHSDAWLMSMAFFNAARLDAEGRRLLFNEINSLPTCLEIVLGKARGNGPIAGAAQISKRAAEPPSALHQEPGKRLAQSEYEDAQMATSELPVRLVGEMNGGERRCGRGF